jgi:hypothetical protein
MVLECLSDEETGMRCVHRPRNRLRSWLLRVSCWLAELDTIPLIPDLNDLHIPMDDDDDDDVVTAI